MLPGDNESRRSTINALVHRGDQYAIDTIVGALSDEIDSLLRIDMVYCLSQIAQRSRYDAATSALKTVALSHTDPSTRSLAEKELASLGTIPQHLRH